jgi:hypothetical protein
MKHNITELWYKKERYKNGNGLRYVLCTLEHLGCNNIPVYEAKEKRKLPAKLQYVLPYRAQSHHTADTVQVLDMENDIKIIYMYGEHTWFDTREERDEYRARMNAQRNLRAKKVE